MKSALWKMMNFNVNLNDTLHWNSKIKQSFHSQILIAFSLKLRKLRTFLLNIKLPTQGTISIIPWSIIHINNSLNVCVELVSIQKRTKNWTNNNKTELNNVWTMKNWTEIIKFSVEGRSSVINEYELDYRFHLGKCI